MGLEESNLSTYGNVDYPNSIILMGVEESNLSKYGNVDYPNYTGVDLRRASTI
jgi:hypothetical protein